MIPVILELDKDLESRILPDAGGQVRNGMSSVPKRQAIDWNASAVATEEIRSETLLPSCFNVVEYCREVK